MLAPAPCVGSASNGARVSRETMHQAMQSWGPQHWQHGRRMDALGVQPVAASSIMSWGLDADHLGI